MTVEERAIARLALNGMVRLVCDDGLTAEGREARQQKIGYACGTLAGAVGMSPTRATHAMNVAYRAVRIWYAHQVRKGAA